MEASVGGGPSLGGHYSLELFCSELPGPHCRPARQSFPPLPPLLERQPLPFRPTLLLSFSSCAGQATRPTPG